METENVVNMPEPRTTTQVTWIYSLTKATLEGMLTQLGLDSTGTLDELRRRMSNYLKTKVREEPQAGGSTETSTPAETRRTESNTVSACEKVRKWGIIFDGKSDALSFLESINERQECYQLPEEDLLRSLPLLFKNTAILWYRNTKEMWNSWEGFRREFKKQYLHPRFDRMVDDEIRARLQQTNESFRDYYIAIITLLRRGKPQTESDKLERVYQNMLPEYKFYIKRTSIHSISELLEQAVEYESIKEEQTHYTSRNKSSSSSTPFRTNRSGHNEKSCTANAVPKRVGQTGISKNSQPRTSHVNNSNNDTHLSQPERRCWRCGRFGHRRNTCKLPSVLFCAKCGKKDVLSKNCNCPGNVQTVAPRS